MNVAVLPPLSWGEKLAILHRQMGACRLRAESAEVVVRNCPGRSAAEFLCVAAAYVREV